MMKLIMQQGILILTGFALAFSGPADAIIDKMISTYDYQCLAWETDSWGSRNCTEWTTDYQARIDLRQMSMDVMAPPVIEANRAAYETDLINGLNKNLHPTIKALIMGELELVGKEGCVDALKAFLDDDDLYEHATEALVKVYRVTGDENVKAAIRTPMASAEGKKLVNLMKAAGSIRDRDAGTQDILLANAGKSDWSLRGTALRSLANIGDPRARQALADALSTTNSYEKSKIITWNLLYARRLAERNLKDDATAVANGIKTYAQTNTLGGCDGSTSFLMAADYTLSEIPDIPVSAKKMPGAADKVKLDILSSKNNGLIINIQFKEDYHISIADVMGRVIWSKEGSRSSNHTVPRSIFGAGVYTINVKSGDTHSSKHIVLY
jgi:HEAT repeat protein